MICNWGPFYPIWRWWRNKRNKYFRILKNWVKYWIWSLKNTNGLTCRSFYCCLVAIYNKGAPLSHFSLSILQTIFNFSALKQVFSICTNFYNDWWKTWPDIRNLVFLLNEELYRKFATVLKLYQRWMSISNVMFLEGILGCSTALTFIDTV